MLPADIESGLAPSEIDCEGIIQKALNVKKQVAADTLEPIRVLMRLMKSWTGVDMNTH